MRYVFFGTPEFAAIILGKLVEAGLPPALVVTNPDRPVGRKKIMTSPPAKIVAEKSGIPVWQPEDLKIENCKLKIGGFDFAVVAAYAKIIPKDIVEMFPLGILGVHPSLLPRHRGASPIQTAILEGDLETGVTLYRMDERVDHGPILASQVLFENIDNVYYGDLTRKLSELAGEMLIEFLPSFEKGTITGAPQNESEATYTKKFKTEDGFVDLQNDDPVLIERKIRALNPEPGVWTNKDGRRMKILEVELNPPAGGDKLKLKKIQFEGEKPKLLKN